MASRAFKERHTQLDSRLLQHVNTGQNCIQNNPESSGASTKAWSCVTFGNFPAYYRARRDFRASSRNEAISGPDLQHLYDAIDSVFRGSCPSGSSERSLVTVSAASLEERRPVACGTRGERLPVDSSSLYDLDWRLGSLADFDQEIFAGKDVLDLGCNTGRISFIVASLMQAHTVLGADIDATLISRARAELRHLQRRYGRAVAEEDRGPLPPHGRIVSTAKDNTDPIPWSDESFAKPSRREEATGFSLPLAVRRTKRKKLSSTVAPADATHAGSSNRKKELLNCGWIHPQSCWEDLPLEETTRYQQSCLDTPTTSATIVEDPQHEGVLSANKPRMTDASDSAVRPANAKVTFLQRGAVTGIKESVRRDLTGTEHGISFTSGKTADRRLLYSDVETPHVSEERAAGRIVGVAVDELAYCRAGRPEHRTARRKYLSHNNRLATGRRAFPYNISFCVADALSGRPWHLPTICMNTCGSATGSALCFCGLTEEIREQQAQVSLQTPVVPYRMTETESCDESFERQYVRTGGDVIRAPLEWEKLQKAFDVVICFSLTKWIHLHHGDKGILLLFARLHALLKDGGLLLLEPQDWASYRRARRRCASFKNQLKCIRLFPRVFCSLLTRNWVCSCSGELISCGGKLPGSQHCRSGLEEASETQLGCGCPFKMGDSKNFTYPSHGCPFGLLAMLHPWSDLEKNTAHVLAEDNVNQAKSTCSNPLPALPSCSHSGLWRRSMLNSTTQRKLFEKGSITHHDKSPYSQKCISKRKGACSSVHDQAAFLYQRRKGESGAGAFGVDKDAVNLSQKDSHRDEASNSECEAEAGEQDLPLRQESASLCPYLLQCQRRSVVKKCASEGYDQDSSVSRAVAKRSVKDLTSEYSKDQRSETFNNNNLQVELVQEATRELRESRCETDELGARSGTGIQTCTAFVVSQGVCGSGEDQLIRVKSPADALSEAHCSSQVRETYAAGVTKTKESISQGSARTWKEQDIRQGMQTLKVKRLTKSEGTLGNRFVYVLQKVSSDFTLCCKQLQECAHAKAACSAMRSGSHECPRDRS